MPLIIPANSLSSGGYSIDNSCRFNDGSSDYLSRTPASAGNRRTWTWSGWVKRSQIGSTYNNLFSGGVDSDTNGFVQCAFWGDSSDWLEVTIYNSAYLRFRTTQLFRDTSAWYHIVIGFDSTQGTNTNRVKIYVNGEQISSFATYNTLAQNFDSAVNNTEIQKVGAGSSSASSVNNYYDGYIAEAVLVDGQQLAADSFGEFDEDSGIWKPIDVSGNGNDFTVNNLTAIDQTTDTCTNNFCTLSPLWNSFNQGDLSEGNLKSSMTSGAYKTNVASFGVSQGKWYWEIKITSASNVDFLLFGVTDESNNLNATFIDVSTLYNNTTGKMRISGSEDGSASAKFAQGDIVGIALNMDDKQISIYKNGSALHSNVAMATTSNLVFPCHIAYTYATYIFEYNFGGTQSFAISSGNADGNSKGNFEYLPPEGYFALCTANLAEFG